MGEDSGHGFSTCPACEGTSLVIIEWDADGYPTEESLERLKEALRSEDVPVAARAFYAALRENRWPGLCGPETVEVRGEPADVWSYHTGGSGGNEDIIMALRESWLFWWLLERYDRGGHWYFRHPRYVPGMEQEAEVD